MGPNPTNTSAVDAYYCLRLDCEACARRSDAEKRCEVPLLFCTIIQTACTKIRWESRSKDKSVQSHVIPTVGGVPVATTVWPSWTLP